jgi:phosphatidylglycerophosphatase A
MDSTNTPKKTLLDYISLAIATFGVGYLPLAPGTWGSAVGVLIFLLYVNFTTFSNFSTAVWIIFVVAVCAIGTWAAQRAERIFNEEDPQRVVVDEVAGQLITYSAVAVLDWKHLLVGFILFRLFDIWKPYPINKLQDLHGGFGVMADDVLAGIYSAMIIYSLTFFNIL